MVNVDTSKSYLRAMFHIMAVLISSSVLGTMLLLLHVLLGDMAPQKLHSPLLFNAIPLKVTSEVRTGLQGFLIPFPAKVLVRRCFFFVWNAQSLPWEGKFQFHQCCWEDFNWICMVPVSSRMLNSAVSQLTLIMLNINWFVSVKANNTGSLQSPHQKTFHLP